MKLSQRQRELLAQRRAARVEVTEAAAELAAELRAFYYPRQAGFFRSTKKLRATIKTRRAGATTGGVREFLARAVSQKGFRATYVATTAIEARARAWENDTANGLVDVIRQFGKPVHSKGVPRFILGGIPVDVYDGSLTLEFGNGSQLELFGADNEGAINKKRGIAKHAFWIDEAQDFKQLEKFYKSVAVAALQDFRGECWISGTPGQDCSGMFYQITKEPEPDDDEDTKRLQAAWEVHRIAQIDNPFFGETAEERWDNTAGAAMIANGWTVEDPDFIREMTGRWVREDGLYVYDVHKVPEHELCYAPARYDIDGFPDIEAALQDLPDFAGRSYFMQAGADLGTRAAFAFVLWSWSLVDPTLYEVVSWKKPGLNYDQMAERLKWLRERVVIGAITADAGGGGKPAVMGWSEEWHKRYGVPIDEADKANKHIAQKLLNTDIRTGKLKLRRGGVLITEMRAHRWEKLRSVTGALVEASTPRDACDAGLYGHRMSYHHRGKTPPPPPPPPGTAAYHEREEKAVERAIEEDMEGASRPWWS